LVGRENSRFRLQSYNFFLEYANFFVKKMHMEEKVVLLRRKKE